MKRKNGFIKTAMTTGVSALALALCLTGCKTADAGDKETKADQTRPETFAATEAETVKQNSDEDIKALKALVLGVMNDGDNDQRKDPVVLFDLLDGDYSLTEIDPDKYIGDNVPLAEGMKGTTLYNKYDGSEIYQQIKDGYLSMTAYDGETATVMNLMEADESMFPTSFLGQLGFDWSLFASGDSEDESEAPVLTADMLTVSDDGKTCTISQDYLKQAAKNIFENNETTGDDSETLLKNLTASGVYTAEDHTVRITLESKSDSLSSVKIETAVTEENGLMVSYSMNMEIKSTNMNVKADISMEDLVYDGNEPTGALFTSHMIMEIPMQMMGVSMNSTSSVTTICKFDVADPAKTAIEISMLTNSSYEMDGETGASSAKAEASVKSSADGKYLMEVNVETDGEATAKIVGEYAFDGSVVPEIPAAVSEAVQEAIDNYNA